MSKMQRRAGANIIKFMAVLLVLTIIARGVSGAALARVYTTFPSRGEIVQEVSGTAIVSSSDTIDIFAPEGLVITDMLASVGQTIQVGDAVARFDIHEINTKLIRETAEFEKKLLDMEILERSEAVDSFNVDNNQRALVRAHEDFNLTKRRGEADAAAAKTKHCGFEAEARSGAWFVKQRRQNFAFAYPAELVRAFNYLPRQF